MRIIIGVQRFRVQRSITLQNRIPFRIHNKPFFDGSSHESLIETDHCQSVRLFLSGYQSRGKLAGIGCAQPMNLQQPQCPVSYFLNYFYLMGTLDKIIQSFLCLLEFILRKRFFSNQPTQGTDDFHLA